MIDKRLARRALLAAATALALAWASGPARAADLTVGANIGNVPWEFQDASGQYRRLRGRSGRTRSRKRLGKTVGDREHPVQRACSRPCSPAGSTWRCPRSRSPKSGWPRSRFAQPYYDSDQSLTVHRGQRHRQGLDDLKGKIVGVDTGSTGDIWATREPGQVRLRRYPPLRRASARRCSTSRPAASTATSATSRPCCTTARTSRSSKWSSGSRAARNTRSCSPRTAPLAAGQRRSSPTLKKEGYIADPAREVVRRRAGRRHHAPSRSPTCQGQV